ncbi:MAG: zf-HC2 domain-containing protein [Solirubrobacterales bacterium]
MNDRINSGFAREDITCKELVELVTMYLEGALAADDRRMFEEHLGICGACVTYVEQIRQTIIVAGRVTEDTIDPAARDELMNVFRGWHARQA